jgi:F-type H+-transporting ATPase subunit delta
MKQSLSKISSFIADNLTKENTEDFAKSLYEKLIKAKNLGKLDRIIDLTEERYAQNNNQIRAKIISCNKLDPKEVAEISRRLKDKYKKEIFSMNEVDPNVLGGIKIKINDEIIDLSWAGKFKNLKSKLTGEL